MEAADRRVGAVEVPGLEDLLPRRDVRDLPPIGLEDREALVGRQLRQLPADSERDAPVGVADLGQLPGPGLAIDRGAPGFARGRDRPAVEEPDPIAGRLQGRLGAHHLRPGPLDIGLEGAPRSPPEGEQVPQRHRPARPARGDREVQQGLDRRAFPVRSRGADEVQVRTAARVDPEVLPVGWLQGLGGGDGLLHRVFRGQPERGRLDAIEIEDEQGGIVGPAFLRSRLDDDRPGFLRSGRVPAGEDPRLSGDDARAGRKQAGRHHGAADLDLGPDHGLEHLSGQGGDGRRNRSDGRRMARGAGRGLRRQLHQGLGHGGRRRFPGRAHGDRGRCRGHAADDQPAPEVFATPRQAAPDGPDRPVQSPRNFLLGQAFEVVDLA